MEQQDGGGLEENSRYHKSRKLKRVEGMWVSGGNDNANFEIYFIRRETADKKQVSVLSDQKL